MTPIDDSDPVALLRRLWRSLLITFHLGYGMVLLVITGALWNPHTRLVKTTKQWWLGRIPRLLGVRMQVLGTPPEPSDEGCLLVSNHISWLDIPLIGGSVATCFVAKAEVAAWPVIGVLAKKAGTLFIRRGSGDSARVSALMAETLAKGRSVLFFPEGTTTDGSELKRLHVKLFSVCHYRPVTVQPLVIRYWSLTGHNPVPFIDDDTFGRHLWNLMGHAHTFASIEFLPALRLEAEPLAMQIGALEESMRQALARLDTHALPPQ